MSKSGLTQNSELKTHNANGVSVQRRLEDREIDRQGREIRIAGQTRQHGMACSEELFRQRG
jgi:hypothetical protein